MPASPVTIFAPPPVGATPTAPGAIYEPAPAGKAVLVITGVATAGLNGSLIYAGLNDAKAAWSSDGTLTPGASNTICKSDAGTWSLSRGSAYAATKTSATAAPDGLTAWTVTTGTASPTLAAASVAVPIVSFSAPSAGAAPTAPGIVFTPPSQVGTPAAPAAIFPPSTNSGLSLTTNFSGLHNDLRFDQVGNGPAPTIQFIMDNAGGDSVTVTGTAILVHLRQNFGEYYLTAANIKQLLADKGASLTALVTVSFAPGNNGTGQIAQPTTTNIAFGPSALA